MNCCLPDKVYVPSSFSYHYSGKKELLGTHARSIFPIRPARDLKIQCNIIYVCKSTFTFVGNYLQCAHDLLIFNIFFQVSNMVMQLLHSIKYSVEVPFSNIAQQPSEITKMNSTKKVRE